ncbi:MAG: histidinol-phosphate transaminase [Acidimicrobiia bacterium]
MPRFRSDLEAIPTYDPGPPTAEIAAELGLEGIIELGANECPVEPFPEVQAAIAAAASDVHRYPLSDGHYLAEALAAHHGVAPDRLWIAPGSTAILTAIALAASGPGSSVVFADPSFVVYRMAALLAGAEPVAVPVDSEWRLDPEALMAAIRPDTAVLYFCNPNNPTGTHVTGGEVDHLVASVSDSVTLVIDEAYAEYATAPDYSSAIPLTLDRDNVVVTRTFSKVYGLAGLRVGYAFGDPETIRSLRRPQAPYATGALAQVAAIEALRHQDRIQQRVAANAAGRTFLADELRRLDQLTIDSQTNFVLWKPDADPARLAADLLAVGIMVRPMGPWIRVTVGTEAENRRFIEALSGLLTTAGS